MSLEKATICGVICVMSLASCQSGDHQHNSQRSTEALSYEGVGVVKAITPSKTFVNIDHEEIEGFMEAMEMFFPVKDTTLLETVQISDSVRFSLEVTEGNYVIVDVTPLNEP